MDDTFPGALPPTPPAKEESVITFPSQSHPTAMAPTIISDSPASSNQGTLVVVVLKARHLPTTSHSRWTKQSPYASLTLYTQTSTSTPDASTTEDCKPRFRKRSTADSQKRRDSLASIPPVDRADALARLKTKLDRDAQRARKASVTPVLPASPEADETIFNTDVPTSASPLTSSETLVPSIDIAVEPEFDPQMSLSTIPDKRGGQHPSWDAELRFPLPDSGPSGVKRYLTVEVWAKVGLGRKDRPLGSAQLDIEPALQTGAFDVWLPLTLNNIQRGEIFLNLTHFVAPPSQLIPHAGLPPPPIPKEVPSALNSLLWRHGIPIRIPSFKLHFSFLVRRPANVPEWVQPGSKLKGQEVGWTGTLVDFAASLRRVLFWGWSG